MPTIVGNTIPANKIADHTNERLTCKFIDLIVSPVLDGRSIRWETKLLFSPDDDTFLYVDLDEELDHTYFDFELKVGVREMLLGYDGGVGVLLTAMADNLVSRLLELWIEEDEGTVEFSLQFKNCEGTLGRKIAINELRELGIAR